MGELVIRVLRHQEAKLDKNPHSKAPDFYIFFEENWQTNIFCDIKQGKIVFELTWMSILKNLVFYI